MIIPDEPTRQAEFIRWVLDVCLTSRKDRKDLYDRRRQFFLYGTSADQEVMTICVVEEASALDEIDAIAATPGVDVLFIGTSDLSFSLGLRGRQNEPELQAAIARVAGAAKRHGKFLGRPAGTPEDVRRHMEQGFLLFQMPTEIGLMELGARQLLEPLGISGIPAGQRAIY